MCQAPEELFAFGLRAALLWHGARVPFPPGCACARRMARDALAGPPPLGRPAYAQPLSPSRQVPASMAFATDSNRPQPLWQPPATACLTASGAASEVPSLLMHPWGWGTQTELHNQRRTCGRSGPPLLPMCKQHLLHTTRQPAPQMTTRKDRVVLITFDVDGTLCVTQRKPGVAHKSLHRRAFSHAFSEVLGLDASIGEVKHHGMTDPLIILKVCTPAASVRGQRVQLEGNRRQLMRNRRRLKRT